MDATKLTPQNKNVYRENFEGMLAPKLLNFSDKAVGTCQADIANKFPKFALWIGLNLDK